jgi:hypothetical protein
VVLLAIVVAVAIAVSAGAATSADSTTTAHRRATTSGAHSADAGHQSDGLGDPWTADVYWVSTSGFLATPMSFYGTVDASDVVAALENGPVEVQYVPGLHSLISRDLVVSTASRDGSTVFVDLVPGFEAVLGGDMLPAFAELTLSLTSMPDVSTVVYDVDGRRVAVPTSAQPAVTRPVSKDDYVDLLSR